MDNRRVMLCAVGMAIGLCGRAAEGTGVISSPAGSVENISAADPRFRYGGRFDFSDPSNPVVVWEASTIGIDFDGNQLSVRFGKITGQVFFDASVDGKTSIISLKEGMSRDPGTIPVSGPGPHHLVLFKRSEATAGTAQFSGIEIAAGARASRQAAPAFRMRMEFIGDSITVGACVEDGPKDQWEDRSTHNAAYSYAALTASEFSADYRNISISGIGLATGYVDVLAGQTWDRTYPKAASPRADLGAWVPDVVLVLLGDNDDSYPRENHLPFPGNFADKYAALIHAIRTAYPEASVVLLNGGMWAGTHSEPLKAAWEKTVSGLEAGDPGISHFTFAHWTANHPRIADHRALADELNAWLKRQPFMANEGHTSSR